MFVQENFLLICAICFVTTLSSLVLYACYLEFFAFRVPKNLPSLGFRNEFFGRTRASFRQLWDSPYLVEEGYKQYGQNQSFLVPHASCRPQVMLPQQYIKWLVATPETILNPEVVRMDRQGIDYFPLSTDSRTNLMAAHKIIADGLNRYLDAFQPQIIDGIQYAVDKNFGTDTDEWVKLPLMDTVTIVLDGIVTRVLFGKTLSRDERFMKVLRGFIIGGGILTELIGQLPIGLFRPILAIPVSWFTMIAKKININYLIPYVKESQRKVNSEEDSGRSKIPEDEEYDFITQCIRICRKFKFTVGMDEGLFLGDILMFIALAAVVSTRTTTVNALLAILGPGAKDDTYDALHQEAAAFVKSSTDWNDPALLKNIDKIDSALRESARLNPLQTRGLLKQVMRKEGIDLPDGTHVAQGTWVGVPVEAIHLDETFYPNPHDYDAFRFSRLKEAAKTGLDFSQQSDTYMFFSYGRSVCPGRWFATRVMKLVVAYIAFHYEIKPLTESPKRHSLGDTKLHHTAVKMVVRRRKIIDEKVV